MILFTANFDRTKLNDAFIHIILNHMLLLGTATFSYN